jgi:protein gp37
MNRQNEKKISWCDATVNPVMGCPGLCGAKFDDEGKMVEEPWCYAYKQNKRFKWLDDFSKPQFFPERLKEFESKKPKSIFIDSMSDIGAWKQEWFDEMINAIRNNPQHNYITLTKQPRRLNELTKNMSVTDLGNLFFGVSVTKQFDMSKLWWGIEFLSIEPILEPIDINVPEISSVDLIIIGAQTGNRKDKVIPQKQWIDDIVKQADERKVKVFMKESLRRLMGADFRQDKLIWQI